MSKSTRPTHGAYHEPPKIKHIKHDVSATGRVKSSDPDGISKDAGGPSGKLPKGK